MLTCIACSKKVGGGVGEPIQETDDEDVEGVYTPSTRHAVKSLTAQIKDMAVKASGAYRHCKPCAGAGERRHGRRFAVSERYHYVYQRAGESGGSTPNAGGMLLTSSSMGRELADKMRGLSSGEGTPPSMSGRTDASGSAIASLFEEEDEGKEWVAQVEPGVLITFVSGPQGGNDLKRVRFSREMFDKWQAQRWWAENYDKVMELYNVQKLNRQEMPLPTPPRSEDETSKDSPGKPPLSREPLPHNFHRTLLGDGGVGYLSANSLEHPSNNNGYMHRHHQQSQHYYDSGGLNSTPKLSSISCAKTETASVDASARTSSEDRSRGLSVSISNASDQDREWVEEDEPGVYITIRELSGGIRELCRIRFSREKFGEMHARLWWEENRARIHEQYL